MGAIHNVTHDSIKKGRRKGSRKWYRSERDRLSVLLEYVSNGCLNDALDKMDDCRKEVILAILRGE